MSMGTPTSPWCLSTPKGKDYMTGFSEQAGDLGKSTRITTYLWGDKKVSPVGLIISQFSKRQVPRNLEHAQDCHRERNMSLRHVNTTNECSMQAVNL